MDMNKFESLLREKALYLCRADRLEDRKGEFIMKLKIVLEPSEEGGFTIYVPSLPGCIS